MTQPRRLILIDCENLPISVVPAIRNLRDARTAVRGYGNWRSGSLRPWLAQAPHLAMTRIQNPTSKNNADIALALDALEFAYAGVRDFVVCTSDGDAALVVRRLEALGARVLVVSDDKPSALLSTDLQAQRVGVHDAIRRAIATGTWCPLTELGQRLRQADPDNRRPYPRRWRLADLVADCPGVEVRDEGGLAVRLAGGRPRIRVRAPSHRVSA